ncbi:MAG: transcriptional regulator PpsR [Rhodobacteraceae bacterium]|nr:transcriptional regulator PpsR [Paracoccaceae bacterium]
MKQKSDNLWKFGSIPMIEPEDLGIVLATSSDIAVLLNSDTKISSILVNKAEKSYGNLDHWIGRKITDFLTTESIPKIKSAIGKLENGETVLYGLELNHVDNAYWQFPIKYNIHRLGKDGQIILLGRDLQTISENQQRFVKAQIASEESIEEKRELEAHFKVLLTKTTDALAFINAKSGEIIFSNPAFQELFFNDDFKDEKTKMESFIAGNSERKGFMEKLSIAAHGSYDISEELETTSGEVIFSITPNVYRAAGQQIIICKFLPKTIRKQGEKELTENLLATFHNSSDAIIFTDVKGSIQYTNERFLDLTNTSHKNEIIAQNLSDFLGRGEIDLAIMLENVMKSGAVKIYSTHLKSSFGTKIDIEASVSRNNSDANGLIAFIVREVLSPSGREKASKVHSKLEHSQDEVAAKELVGSATLKEIVTDTTDVIEKICIEAALGITNNNRAAAADLLGLSRQSLYVKLSKFEM